ncbi:hypothetical protein GCM10007275_16480 [Jeotgalicoccus coquinae]|uniref:Magnesium-transporting ATPase (P-type) n=1 Tax=Jeotgalicoccus coquinae TaxID=709509 RepID=A0A6V7R0W0_9STAP|nr:hypothetical protein [Jeotgalicoccus coquinae]MBB6423727.1 magnesium-transporting ATPase (P-type) [Jeotgalicoccus coquinae]GGE22122.1 hypothetical protein GCM10007275_16480 [Jeotgalicoccus coquinae]CAD2070936.1 hypothetical protein JEOCOQ751_00081 [Jeotgalicoccus coquinae]
MVKGELLRGSLYVTLINLIILDFYHTIPWYIQYGPIIVVGIVTVLSVVLDKDNNEEENKKAPILYRLFLLISLCLVVISMNVAVGEPSTELFNIYSLSFWTIFIAVPLLSSVYSKVKERES